MDVVYNKNIVNSNDSHGKVGLVTLSKLLFIMQQFILLVHLPALCLSMWLFQGENFNATIPATSIECLRTNQSSAAFATFKK